jgi:hypothetical protein
MAKINTKRLTKIALIVTLLIFSWVIFEGIVRGFNVVKSEYGIDPALFVKVLVGAEIFFDLGIVLILLGSGVFKLRLRHIFNLDFQNVKFDNKLVYAGFTINRIAAFIPPAYLVFAGWGKLPWGIMGLILFEIVTVLLIATLPFEGKRLFPGTRNN